jgi:PAS domain S-box-containing protein
MTVVSLLYAFALACYSALAVRVLARRPRTALNWTAALVLAGLAVWSVEDIIHGIPAAPLSLVHLFSNIGSFGWGTFAAMNLLFTLVFTRHRRLLKSRWVYPLLVVPPVLTIVAQFTGHINQSYRLTPYGWTTVWDTCAWPAIFYVYYSSYTLLSLGLVLRFRFTSTRVYERKQAGLIFASGVVPLLLGTASDIILPRLTGLRMPDLAGAFVLIWAGGIYYAVTRYGLMNVTPQAAADDILATMPDALLLLAPDGRVARANQAGLDLFGYRAAELAGMQAEMLLAQPATFRAALAAISLGEQACGLELDCRTRDGRLVPLSISGRPMRDRHAETVGIVLVLQDITRRRQAEAALAQAQAELLRREKLATLGQVAGSVAHELRNPLGAIRNAAYFLSLAAAGKLDGKAEKHLRVINDEITHSNQIITSLLDFARGRLCEPAPLRVADVVASAVKRAELPQRITLRTRLPEDLPEVNADAYQLEQVFFNLISNAGQAMRWGGVLGIDASRSNGTVRVRVSDTGSGIAPEHMKRLFEPLFSTKTFGVGLGLAISRNFVEANKGTISVETEVGKGTTFTVVLPAAGQHGQDSGL